MSNDFGILIAEDGDSIKHRAKVDSRRKTLILDLEADPPHMQIITTTGGSTYTDTGTGRSRDVLFSMDHELGFAALADVYFYVKTVDGSTTDPNVNEYGGEAYFLSGTLGTYADIISYEVDVDEFRIVHYFDRFGFDTGIVSPAPNYLFQIKFYIYSIDTGREINYGYPFDASGNPI